MYCDKCGAPIPEGQDHCPNCQSAAEAEQTGFFPETPAEPEEFQLNLSPDEQPGRSGKKTALLAIGAAAAVALIGLVIAWVCGAFRSPQQQLLHIETVGAKAASAAIAEGYEAYIDTMQSQLPGENGYSSEVDYRLRLKDGLWNMAVSSITETDMSAVDLSWIEHILLHADIAAKDGRMDMGLGIGLNDTVLVSANVLMDTAQGSAAIGFPELTKQYLGADLTMTGMSPDMISKSTALLTQLAQDLPEKDAVREMLEGYFDIALGYIQTVEKSTETVSVGASSKSVTVLKLTLTEEQLMALCTDILTAAKTDETLKQFLTAISSYYNGITEIDYDGSGYFYEPEDLYAQFLDSLAEALADLEAAKESIDPANYIEISNYVYKNVIIGRKAEVFSAEEAPASAGYLVIPKADGFSFQVTAPDLLITGSGEGGKLECTLTAEGEELLKLETEGVAYAENSLSGTIRLYPSEALLAELGLDESYAFLADLSGCYLEIVINSSQETGNLKFSVVAGGETLGSLEMVSTVKMEANITMPETVLDAGSDTDMSVWVKSLRFDTLIANLEAAKVPSDYVDMVRRIVTLLEMQLSMAA